MASVALLEEKQAISLLPMYVCRNRGEKILAEVASKKETLAEALDELQSLIDGEISQFTWMERFCNSKPEDRSCTSSLVAFFFELMAIAKSAGVPYELAVVRYVNMIPKGEQVYSKIKSSVKADMSEAEASTLFQTIRPLLEPEQNEARNDVFISSQEKGEVADLRNQVTRLSRQFTEAFKAQEPEAENQEDDTEAYFQKRMQKSKKMSCKICKKKGHESATCFQRVCSKCEGKGHDSDVCPSKFKPRNTSRQR